MATFVSTINFTRQGITNIRDTTKRAASFTSEAQKMGVEVTEMLWTLGAADGLLIFEAPDDKTASALMLQLASLGNVQTQTTRAFREAEMSQILSKLS